MPWNVLASCCSLRDTRSLAVTDVRVPSGIVFDVHAAHVGSLLCACKMRTEDGYGASRANCTRDGVQSVEGHWLTGLRIFGGVIELFCEAFQDSLLEFR